MHGRIILFVLLMLGEVFLWSSIAAIIIIIIIIITQSPHVSRSLTMKFYRFIIEPKV